MEMVSKRPGKPPSATNCEAAEGRGFEVLIIYLAAVRLLLGTSLSGHRF